MIEANETTNKSGPPEQGERGVHAPHERTCVGCGERSAPGEMVRLVIAPSGEIAVDAAGGGFGRGAHVHARGSCLAQAASRGLLRATKGRGKTVSVAVKEAGEVVTSEARPMDAGALASAIEAAMTRRIEGLLGTAVRTGKGRVGSNATTSAWRAGDASLIVVATDADAAADLSAVRDAVSSGAAVAWGTKASLGMGVMAITDTRIASAVRDAVEKAMGTRNVGAPPLAGGRRGRGNDSGQRRPQGGVEDAATKAGFRSKVGADRAERFSRQTRRETSGDLSGKRRAAIVPAQGKQAVERSE